jgi:hypothetical protein
VTRPLGAINQVETRDGTAYAGIRYEFAIYPQEEGSFAVADQKVTVTYAAEPRGNVGRAALGIRSVHSGGCADFRSFCLLQCPLPRTGCETIIAGPEGRRLFTRTVTTKADGTPAMLLPPVTFTRINELCTLSGPVDPAKVYLALLNWLRRFEPARPGAQFRNPEESSQGPGTRSGNSVVGSATLLTPGGARRLVDSALARERCQGRASPVADLARRSGAPKGATRSSQSCGGSAADRPAVAVVAAELVEAMDRLIISNFRQFRRLRIANPANNRQNQSFWAEWDFPGPVVGLWSNSIPDPQTAFNGPG